MKIGFNTARETQSDRFFSETDIIEDRGSRYGVTLAYATGKKDIFATLDNLMSKSYFSHATHNSWAFIATHDNIQYEFYNDDGEAGAGKVILREMQKAHVTNCVVIVTRHFGGIKLEQDRYAHIQDSARYALQQVFAC